MTGYPQAMNALHMLDCPLCRIGAGIAQATLFYRDEQLLVMAAPDSPDEVLVVPLVHVHRLFDLPTEVATRLIDVAVQASAALRIVREVDAQTICMAKMDESTPFHFHVRIIPHDQPGEHLAWLTAQPSMYYGNLIDPLIRSMQKHIE